MSMAQCAGWTYDYNGLHDRTNTHAQSSVECGVKRVVEWTGVMLYARCSNPV